MEQGTEKPVPSGWEKSKPIIKACIIAVIALVLMIPMVFIKNLVMERDNRQREATKEISSKWAGPQKITGPVIGVPYWNADADSSGRRTAIKQIAWFLPETLLVNATIVPKEKHRGIYKVMLYESKVGISGNFRGLNIAKLNISPGNFIWNEAFAKFTITDVKGLNDQFRLIWKGNEIECTPQVEVGGQSMIAPIPAFSESDFINAAFSASLDLNGSEQLQFTPVGKSTIVNLGGSWKHPSFAGSTLPQTSNVNDTGFKATWKSMAHKRGFPQQWTGNSYRLDHDFPEPVSAINPRDIAVVTKAGQQQPAPTLGASAFGVDLYIPVNDYQRTMRTVKYAILCILLTFAAFFLIETSQKRSVHPFQYGLVGLALILFYTLLLSVSEYTGFNVAYIISSVATISLIAWFVKSILQSGRATSILSVVLVLVYSYVFSLLQLQDYSLLFGSIGLFLTLAVIMYFSRKIQW